MSKKLTIEEMDILAILHNGKCIDKIYKNNKTPLEWECKFGHRWKAIPSNIKQGCWCPVCFVGSRKSTIKEMNILAALKNGKCISPIYENSYTKLKWECSSTHQWQATPDSIKNGRWCPTCSKLKYISEEKCRYIIEQLTEYKFPTIRTALRNKQEIDGYNKELKIGFEYQGEQHYIRTKRFSEKQFQQIQSRDKKKKSRINYLKKQGKIKDIIFIKYTQSTSDKKLENYIIKRLKKIDPNLIKNTNIDYSEFYKYLSPLNEIKEIVKDKGGELSDDIYINSQTKIKIKCKNNHIFHMIPNSLKLGCWCPYCSGNAKRTIEEFRKLVEDTNGKLIDKIYKNTYTKLKIACKKGHIFKMTLNSIKKGHWCSQCSGKSKHTLKEMKIFAEQNNAICCEKIYISNKINMKWKCLKCGNKWAKSYHTMKKRKYFCKTCKLIKQ